MKERRARKGRRSIGNEKDTQLEVVEVDELMTFLINKMTNYSRNKIKSLLTHGQVMVDGKVISQYNHPLHPGQVVTISARRVDVEEATIISNIVYEDDEIIIFDKPAGLLSIASNTNRERTAYRQLMDYVRKSDINNRVFIVHRLDRDTSGLMMFAKNERIQQLLQNSWRDLVEARIYLAVVEGTVSKKEDTVKSWLLETKTKLMYSSPRAGEGLEAITHYKVLQSNEKYSLVEISLETGRKNQIRVHMKDIGHSIVGDKKYGSDINPIGRLALHAQTLTFYHPITKKRMHFETKIPAEFSRLLI